jgi:phosphoglycerate kinase
LAAEADTSARHSKLFSKKTVRDVDVQGKRVLVRVDFNVPLTGEGASRKVADDTRIRAALPTIEYLRSRGARVVLASHLGRPKDREPELSMAPVTKRLEELTGGRVWQAPDVVGEQVERVAERLEAGNVLVLENSRYEPGETKNDPELSAQFARLADLYVNDAFGTAHRAHATTEGVARVLPGVAGLLLEREVTVLSSLLADPESPFVVILGGAKVDDKIGVIERFLDIADAILVGGAMCFSFFGAKGIQTGNSLVDEQGIELARRALESAEGSSCRIELPRDLVIATELSAQAQPRTIDSVEVPDGWMGLDVGPATARAFAEEIAAAATVLWNGPMGAFEIEQFAGGTKAVAEAVADATGTTVVGGGDSVAALEQFGLADRIDHVSTGGGASIELLEGSPLPGVEVLQDA